MKVLVLANNDLGLYLFRKELLAELLLDNEVLVSIPYGDCVDQLSEMGCVFINTFVDRRGINPFKDIKLYRKYRSIIMSEKPDMVITYTIKPNIYGGFACRLTKTNYCVNITGLGTAFERNRILKGIVIRLYKYALRNAKVVFFENSANRDLFVDNGIIPITRTHVLNGAGVNVNYFTYQEYPNNDSFQFLFIGRVMKEKGIDELFIAMKKLIDEGYCCQLNVIGPFEEDYSGILDEYMKEGWLKYYGFQKDVRPFIASCDCFVLPSWHEGMANTNLESASCGRPIITSDIPGCKESVIDGESGLLCQSKNSDSLYDAMRRMMLLDNRKEMGKRGRIHMEQKFDKRVIVSETLNCIFE